MIALRHTAPVPTPSEDDRNLEALLHAYRHVVLREVADGRLAFASCLDMSPAGAAVLRHLGTDARAHAVHVRFYDLEAETIVSTDPAEWEEMRAEPMPGMNPADADNGHAVILTPTKLVDLTFGQFDQRRIAGDGLAVNLADGWRGELKTAHPQGRWAVEMRDMPDDGILRRHERDLPTAHANLVDILCEHAEVHLALLPRRASNVGRNDPCTCGSGRKYKHCHGGLTPPS